MDPLRPKIVIQLMNTMTRQNQYFVCLPLAGPFGPRGATLPSDDIERLRVDQLFDGDRVARMPRLSSHPANVVRVVRFKHSQPQYKFIRDIIYRSNRLSRGGGSGAADDAANNNNHHHRHGQQPAAVGAGARRPRNWQPELHWVVNPSNPNMAIMTKQTMANETYDRLINHLLQD
jgi:hypothetical protein